jgi:hypothetical protein
VGMVSTAYPGPINRACPNGNQTDHIYVKFNGLDGRIIYTKWLLCGSPIYINQSNNKKQLCVICDIIKDADGLIETLRVKDDHGTMIDSSEYTIKEKDIDSMLVWRDGYEIKPE